MAQTIRSAQQHTVSNAAVKPSTRFFALRRLAAWGLELSLVSTACLLPWCAGEWIRKHSSGHPVRLNSAVMATQHLMARTLNRPRHQMLTTAPPLTNLLWFGALTLPVGMIAAGGYSLLRTGSTPPKRWLQLRVVAMDGGPLHIGTVVKRELIGRWGLPIAIAYGVWVVSGAFPSVMLLGGLTLACLLGEGLTAQFQPSRRAFHDWLGRTRVTSASQYIGSYRFLPDSRIPFTGRLTLTEEAGGLTSVIMTPTEQPRRRGISLHVWIQMGSILIGVGMIVAIVYAQNQMTLRSAQAQNDLVFLALVEDLSTAPSTPPEQQTALLALASTRDWRAVPLLVDLLAQTHDPQLLETLQEALVTIGVAALPEVKHLNQALANDLASLPADQRPPHQLRQRTVKRTLAKLLTLHSDSIRGSDLRQTHLGQVLSGPGAYALVLEQTPLVGLNWTGSVLSGARFRKSQFSSPGPDGRLYTYDDWITDFSGSDLTEADFAKAELSGVSFRGASLLRANLIQVKAAYADFSEANLGSARLIDAQLNYANLRQASLVGADLTQAQLVQANLEAAQLSQATGKGMQLQGAELFQLQAREADLQDSVLIDADLTEANLGGSHLKGADLSRAVLQGASLRGADLRGIKLFEADLKNTDFQEAVFYQATAPKGDDFIISAPNPPQTGQFSGVDFSQARNLSPEQLVFICDQEGIHPACSPDSE